jgi:hypothetical protein
MPGVSKRRQWERIAKNCTDPKWVLDNWSTEDRLGSVLYSIHPDACILVLFDSLENILKRYRTPVTAQDAHRMMWTKMYVETPWAKYSRVRFFKVDVEHNLHLEYCYDDYCYTINQMNRFPQGLTFSQEKWEWKGLD